MRTRIYASLVVVCLLAVLGLVAQTRGTISGVVVDATGSPVPGVNATATGPEKRAAVSNERGEFAFVGLLPGAYQLRFALPGFTTVIHNLSLREAGSERIRPVMVTGGVSETVTITGETAPLDTNARREQARGRTDKSSAPPPAAAPAIAYGVAVGIAPAAPPYYHPRPYP